MGPIPLTRFSTSCREAKGPLASRSATILAAVFGPMPGSFSSSAALAVFMSIVACAKSGATTATAKRAASPTAIVVRIF